ncbi:MAG: helix-turn-helix domain-containing protein [Verrucomicrobia bacterium]|nr:helix-turn-helix domain-containing protein [Verrucomicrobiota bacterium]
MSDNEIFDPKPVIRIANRHTTRAGYIWGPRQSPDCQWITVLAGELSYSHGGNNTLVVQKDDLLFIPGGESHVLRAESDGSMAGFHGEWWDAGRWTDGPCPLPFVWRRVTRMPSSARIVETMTRMASLFERFPPFKQQRLSCLAADVLLQLASAWLRDTQPQLSPRTKAMLEWIRGQMPAVIDRNAIAEHFGITPAYVNQVFKKELGLSPGTVVRRERCAAAYHLLQKGFSVSHTAEQLGFADPFHFSRVFTTVYGINPRQIRP